MAICKDCGYENPEGNKFCGECGVKLSDKILKEDQIDRINSDTDSTMENTSREEDGYFVKDENIEEADNDLRNNEAQESIIKENIFSKFTSKIKPMIRKPRFKYIVCALVIVFVLVGIIGYNQNERYKENQFNLNVSEAEKYYNIEEYDKAEDYYLLALEYKNNQSISDKIDLCRAMDQSKSDYILGNMYFDDKKYDKAFNVFKNVIERDEKRFELAAEKMAESSKLFMDEKFLEAKDYAKEGDYDQAISCLNGITNFDSSNETAKTLREQYILEKEKLKKQKEIDNARSMIRIISLYTSRPNSAGGVDLHIVWKNNSSKAIKYIVFDVVPYNAVGDVQYCEIRRNSNYRGQVTGPINPGVTYGYGYQWSNAWYNNTIVKVKLVGVNITYMDDSTASLYESQSQYVIY